MLGLVKLTYMGHSTVSLQSVCLSILLLASSEKAQD
jgi:hypothetical protein